MTRGSGVGRDADGSFRIGPGWAAIFVTLFLAAAAAGTSGLMQSSATAQQVRNNTDSIREVKEDVRYIRARIDTALSK